MNYVNFHTCRVIRSIITMIMEIIICHTFGTLCFYFLFINTSNTILSYPLSTILYVYHIVQMKHGYKQWSSHIIHHNINKQKTISNTQHNLITNNLITLNDFINNYIDNFYLLNLQFNYIIFSSLYHYFQNKNESKMSLKSRNIENRKDLTLIIIFNISVNEL